MKKLWFLVAVIFLMVFNFSSSSGQVKADEIVERKSIQFGAAQYWGKMTLRGEYPTDEKLNSFLKLIFERKWIIDPTLTNPIKDTFSIADLVLEKEISYSPEFKTKVKLWLDNTINYYEFREELIKEYKKERDSRTPIPFKKTRSEFDKFEGKLIPIHFLTYLEFPKNIDDLFPSNTRLRESLAEFGDESIRYYLKDKVKENSEKIILSRTITITIENKKQFDRIFGENPFSLDDAVKLRFEDRDDVITFDRDFLKERIDELSAELSAKCSEDFKGYCMEIEALPAILENDISEKKGNHTITETLIVYKGSKLKKSQEFFSQSSIYGRDNRVQPKNFDFIPNYFLNPKMINFDSLIPTAEGRPNICGKTNPYSCTFVNGYFFGDIIERPWSYTWGDESIGVEYAYVEIWPKIAWRVGIKIPVEVKATFDKLELYPNQKDGTKFAVDYQVDTRNLDGDEYLDLGIPKMHIINDDEFVIQLGPELDVTARVLGKTVIDESLLSAYNIYSGDNFKPPFGKNQKKKLNKIGITSDATGLVLKAVKFLSFDVFKASLDLNFEPMLSDGKIDMTSSLFTKSKLSKVKKISFGEKTDIKEIKYQIPRLQFQNSDQAKYYTYFGDLTYTTTVSITPSIDFKASVNFGPIIIWKNELELIKLPTLKIARPALDTHEGTLEWYLAGPGKIYATKSQSPTPEPSKESEKKESKFKSIFSSKMKSLIIQKSVNDEIKKLNDAYYPLLKKLNASWCKNLRADEELKKAWTSKWYAEKHLIEAEKFQKEGEKLISQNEFVKAYSKYSASLNNAKQSDEHIDDIKNHYSMAFSIGGCYSKE